MIKKHFKFLGKVLIITVIIFICSCNNKEKHINYNEVVFKSNSFKNGLDNFIKETVVNKKNIDESMIVILYINQDSDTIVSITNFKPYETVNLFAVNSYKEYKLYFYAPRDLIGTLNKFIDIKKGSIQNVSLEPIDEGKIDPMHSYSFYVKNNVIVP